jgi:hypothetical protein
MPDTPPPHSPVGDSGPEVARRWLRTDNILLVTALALFVWFTGDVLLLVFAGLLLAVGLDGLTRSVKHWTRCPMAGRCCSCWSWCSPFSAASP